MANEMLWGLTLLERNLRQLNELRIEEVVVLIAEGNAPRRHFRQPLPLPLSVSFEVVDDSDPFRSLRAMLQSGEHPVLVLEGGALNDSRVLRALCDSGSVCGVISPTGKRPAAAAIVSSAQSELFEPAGHDSVTARITKLLAGGKLAEFSLQSFDSYIEKLRRDLPPFLLRVEDADCLKEADDILRQTTHKDVNDFVAKYIHPPLEFGLVRILTHTAITPNQVTLFNLLLYALVVTCFLKGLLLPGILLAALKGVLDGVDGKLARFLLRYSKTGYWLDHAGDTLFDGVVYGALGWHFMQGDFSSPAAVFTLMFVGSYAANKIIPGLFKKIHKHEIYDYNAVDRFIRLIGGRTNNNVWVLMVGIVLGYPEQTYNAVAVWMLATALWYLVRLIYVTVRSRIKNNQYLSLSN